MNQDGAATVTSDAAGVARIRLRGPHRTGTIWQLRTVTVTSQRAGDGSYPTADIYRSIESPSALIGTSRAADRVTFDAEGDHLYPGDYLLIVLRNTAPASTATAAMFAVESTV